MDAAWLLAATGFAIAMSATPGPNNVMVAASGARFGLWRTMPHMLGVALGFPLMLVLVALGAAELLHRSTTLQAVLRWAGAAWMLWLAWDLVRHDPDRVQDNPGPASGGPAMPPLEASTQDLPGRAAAMPTQSGTAAGLARPMRLWQAALFQWVNPKAWIIAAGAIGAYTGSQAGVLVDALALAAIFAPAAFLSLLAWAAVGRGVGRLLRPGQLVWFNRAMAALLVASLVPLVAG